KPVAIAAVDVDQDDEGFPGIAMIDGRPDTGWAKIYGGGGPHTAVFTLAEPLAGSPGSKLIVRLRHETRPRLAIGKFRVSLSRVEGADLRAPALPDGVLAAIRKDPAQRTPAEKAAIIAHYRKVAPELAAARERLAKLEGERSVLLGRIPKTLVSEATTPRVIRILPRG